MGGGKKRKMVTKKMVQVRCRWFFCPTFSHFLQATDKRIKSLQAVEAAEQQRREEEEKDMQLRCSSFVFSLPFSHVLVRSISRSRQYPAHLFFSYNTALGPPYHVLMDTNFINFSIQNKIDIVSGMMDCLYAKCIPYITDCVMGELEKLGTKFRGQLFFFFFPLSDWREIFSGGADSARPSGGASDVQPPGHVRRRLSCRSC